MGPAARFVLRAVRRLSREIDVRLAREEAALPAELRPDDSQLTRYRELLEAFDREESSTGYLKVHGARLARTLSLTPKGRPDQAILELGCYMQITPLLASELGYGSVRGAYFGEAGRTETRLANVQGREVFRCEVDLFDAETDPYPYAEGSFDLVLACEIFEHFRTDPMHMLVESRRILKPGGGLLLTTPNCASIGSVARALRGENPQVFAQYALPDRGEDRAAHVREYTPNELDRALRCAGFETEWLFTERFEGVATETWALELIEQAGFDPRLRGEQIYCLARKRDDAEVERYPAFLYVS
ncbi:MAG: methyltransferase domain-containing protein [Acidobacteria bacterium]|nr:methyltransferase domain-containing protein [Acidobacteriota bacterium]